MNKIIVVQIFLGEIFCQGTGVGLSISQLNDIKNHFDQANIKDESELSVKNIYQNKYHNFSEKFSLEDRLLLVRLYNRYTEEHCMTFKTFARKFKKKANEWINSNHDLHMWERESLRKQKSLEILESFDVFADLESFTEEELLELLQQLEDDEEVAGIESQLQNSDDGSDDNTDEDTETVTDLIETELLQNNTSEGKRM